MNSPRIVVVMSCFNEEQYLYKTIRAVLDQSMPDFRLVVLDNGSTDLSRAELVLWAESDGRITLLPADRNLPPGRVANLLMHVATTLWSDCRWFVGAGADDMMAPDYLETILRAADEHPEANLIFSPWQWIDHPENGVKVFPTFDPETCHAIHQIPAWSAITRELWEQSGGHNETMLAADYDWVARNRYAIRAHQLEKPYISLRIRHGRRKTQSDEVHWPTLHKHLCGIVGKEAPEWAARASGVC